MPGGFGQGLELYIGEPELGEAFPKMLLLGSEAPGQAVHHGAQGVDGDLGLPELGGLEGKVEGGQFEQAEAVVGHHGGRRGLGELLPKLGHVGLELLLGGRVVVVGRVIGASRSDAAGRLATAADRALAAGCPEAAHRWYPSEKLNLEAGRRHHAGSPPDHPDVLGVFGSNGRRGRALLPTPALPRERAPTPFSRKGTYPRRGCRIVAAGANETRINDRIRAREVRLVDADGSQLGIKALPEALQIAREADLDLVEVAPMANPPVCRIMDYGKYKFDAAQRAKESRRKTTNVGIKEMKYRPKIGPGDFDTKTRQVSKFLGQGHKVKITIMFRGREMSHQELGLKILHRVAEEVGTAAKVEAAPKVDGRNMIMVLAPDKRAQVPKKPATNGSAPPAQPATPAPPAAAPPAGSATATPATATPATATPASEPPTPAPTAPPVPVPAPEVPVTTPAAAPAPTPAPVPGAGEATQEG